MSHDHLFFSTSYHNAVTLLIVHIIFFFLPGGNMYMPRFYVSPDMMPIPASMYSHNTEPNKESDKWRHTPRDMEGVTSDNVLGRLPQKQRTGS